MRAAQDESLKAELEEARQHAATLEQALAEAQRMATVGELTGRMAHEFNNILMMIVGRADHALKDNDPELREKALRKAVECGQRAADVVASILGYAKGRQMQSQIVAADRLMDSAASLIAWDLPKSGIQLVRQFETTATVRVVPLRMEQVVLNLILNARNAMRPHGGRLTLAVAEGETPGYVALRVQDTGCGIPAEHIKHIFDPFFTTRPKTEGGGDSQRGTGLGLPVARDLVRQAGGEIHVTSTPGVGSTFTVLLPVVEETNP
ncbi:MAG: sensor histidine kinase [Planctomycetes bacterium]|nr:sensor histidine kinase [Planctomycetota bacterium]